MKPKLTECLPDGRQETNVSLMAEFDPPPLLETTVGIKMVGLKRRRRYYRKRMSITKSGGGV